MRELSHRAAYNGGENLQKMATPLDVVDRLTAKTKWAERQIGDLEITLRKTFPRTKPYGIRFEDDLNAGERSYYVVSVPDVPLTISLMAGDILQNLRSSLDHLACHLVRKEGKPVTSQTSFPIANDATEYMAPHFRRKVEGMGQKAVDAIDVIEPYKGGKGTILWRLHKLNNLDKHRLLLTACSTHVAHSISPSERRLMQEIFRGSHPGESIPELRGHLIAQPVRLPLKAGDKLLTVPIAELEQNMNFLIDIAFDEPKIVECKTIIPVLHEMSEIVLNIILGFSKAGLL
jgi:hypothetical protein